MNIRTLILILYVYIIPEYLLAQVYLIDKTNGNPISYAQITNEKGVTIGITDSNGLLPNNIESKKIIIQHLSYYPNEVETSKLKSNTNITLVPKVYTLEEVSISSKNMDYIHLKTYFRSYQLNDSCMKYYRDGFTDYFIGINNNKSKRYLSQLHNFKNSKLIDKDRKRANSMVDKFIVTPYLKENTLIERLKHEGWIYNKDALIGFLCHNEIQAGIVNTDTVNNILLVSYDALENKKEKKGTLFGYTTRLVSHYETETYHYRNGYQSYMDLINRKGYRKIFYKYKKDTHEQMVEIIDELYVLGNEYVSSKDMKEFKSLEKMDYPTDSIVSPLNNYLKLFIEKEMEEE